MTENEARRFKVALVQTNTKRDPADNIREVVPMIREAAAGGADLITTPEVVGMIEPNRAAGFEKAQPEASHTVLAAFRDVARETGRWLLIGSLSVRTGGEKLANRGFLVAPDGAVAASYDKIHMFDVQVGDGQTYRESNAYEAGRDAVLVDTPFARIGMTICYDVRFPHLYRTLAQAGAQVLTVPAAFTQVTGEAHWHVLLRARAIETGCWVVAPAQTGEHAEGRRTYGHSLVVAPWGEVVADAGRAVGVTYAEIDLAAVTAARGRVPSLDNDRHFELKAPLREIA